MWLFSDLWRLAANDRARQRNREADAAYMRQREVAALEKIASAIPPPPGDTPLYGSYRGKPDGR